MTNHLGFEGIRVDVLSSFMKAKAIASIRDATSSVSGGFYRSLTKEINYNLQVSTPHHYLVQLTANWGDQFKESTGALKVEGLKVQADLECDEAAFVYPTTFQVQAVLMKMIALHAQVMNNNARQPVVMAQTDIIARLTKTLYGGAKIVYDDKAKSLEMQKYGLFWKAYKNFLIGLEYNHIGDS